MDQSPDILIRDKVEDAVKATFGVENALFTLEHPDNDAFGDYACNVALTLSKQLKQSPMEIAKKLSYELQNSDITFTFDGEKHKLFENVDIANPGFINFTLSPIWLKHVLTSVILRGKDYGRAETPNEKTVLVEFSQPNPNKPMHIGHARNNFLGSSISNILSAVGYSVIRANYMNDWGTHICKSMLMYQKYGNNSLPDVKSDHFVGRFYAMYEKEAEVNHELGKELAALFQKMENLDPATIELWKKITGWAYEGWQKTYSDEGVVFDTWMYQSDYRSSGKEIVQIAVDRGIASKDETGAVIAHLEQYGIPDKVLLRSDGTSIYSTQDLQLAKDSYEKYKFDKRLYVVDARQSDYFKQIFKILEVLGFEWASKLKHVAYGFVSLPEGKMSSRTGLVVNADDVFAKLADLETLEISTSMKNVTKVQETARKVAMAAFKYGILRIEPSQEMVFRYDQVTKFEGNTGPYLLYTFARVNSLLEKAGIVWQDLSWATRRFIYDNIALNDKEESLLKFIYRYPEVLRDAAEQLNPSLLAKYLYDLSQKFNSFYTVSPVIDAPDPETKEFRILLTESVGQVLKNGLELLGIEVVEKM